MLAIWTGAPAAPIVALLSPGELQKRWRSAWESRSLVVSLSTNDGTAIFGSVRDGVSLERGRTRLPFVLSVTDAVNSAGDADLVRRGALASGIALAVLLMTAASYGLYRITISELRLARQQSDFVAAVSHEFRTPLTSMRHLLDLLIARGVRDEERRNHYYGLLAGETDRLTRMVETLLSFGRIDAGGQIWSLDPLNVADLVSNIVETFRGETPGRPIVVDAPDDLPEIRGDREALSRALWNLLENAAKYSPPDSPIRVFAERRVGAVVLGVEDRGIGIPIAEQRRVFDKFVRGDDAKRSGIRGVGVGLALVKRIAEAHGGSVRLMSEVGKGSTFTLVLPVTG
jgi:signal transduction histidine kinase